MNASPDSLRKAMHRRRRRRRRKRLAAWALLAVVGLGIGYALSFGWNTTLDLMRQHTDWLVLTNIKPVGQEDLATWVVVEESALELGSDYLAISKEAVETRLMNHPRISYAEMHKKPIGTVELVIRERRPKALLASPFLEIDAWGHVLGAPTEESLDRKDYEVLPLITGLKVDLEQTGSRLDHEGLLRALAFLGRVDLYGYDDEQWISEVNVSDSDSLVVYTRDQALPICVGDGRISKRKLDALFETLEQIRKKAIVVKMVDLRFRDQVVVKQG
ncbi:MAG: FtsQ-type POTRA domain-containing protein [Candidatus Eisenbacteria bacterium]|uniref:FtsQ-type POTRA domain-containing protein n=1 Tax=Eiseniibacteriota bacterium TaxID=2212470 RepID=A0A7Y2E8S9_UNCEI|nr:FtsQ-type POTRA domain-containing protein [Candidatus Eisenbacteria bacterium]